MSRPLIFSIVSTHLFVAVVPIVVFGAFAYRANLQSLREASSDLNLAVVTQLRAIIEARLEERATTLGIAERILSDEAAGPEEKERLLKTLVVGGDLPYLAVRDERGQLDSLFWTGPTKPRLEEILDEDTLRDARALGAWTPRSDVVVLPWTIEDGRVGYLSTGLPLDDIRREVELFRNRFLGAESHIEVADTDGRTIAVSESPHPPTAESLFSGLLKDSEGRGRVTLEVGIAEDFVGVDGRRWFRAAISTPRLGWWLVAARPRSVALASIYRLGRQIAWLAIVAALTACLAGVVLARSISGPVTRLAVAVRASIQGGMREGVPEKGSLELVELSRGFNRAIEALTKQRRELLSETRLRLRLSRYLTVSELQQALSQEGILAAQAGRTGHRTVLVVDLRPQEEATLTQIAPDKLVFFLGEVYSSAAEIIERGGGLVHDRLGDEVVGIFETGTGQEAALAALNASMEFLNRARVLAQRWPAAPAPSVGIATSAHEDDEPGERAARLQQAAPAYGALADELTLATTSGAHGFVQEQSAWGDVVHVWVASS